MEKMIGLPATIASLDAAGYWFERQNFAFTVRITREEERN
jgi:hypothetical protein